MSQDDDSRAMAQVRRGRADALAPAFLPVVPHDLITGGSLRYTRTAKGYRLYSVGWDGQDQGGRPDPSNLEQGDWVWSTGE